MRSPKKEMIRNRRRKCAACGQITGTKHRPGVEFDWPCYVEGYPRLGVWNRIESRKMICAIHSAQVEEVRP